MNAMVEIHVLMEYVKTLMDHTSATVSMAMSLILVGENVLVSAILVVKAQCYAMSYFLWTSLDVDECKLELDDCNENAICDNSDGGYTCSCKRNYFGNGKLCFGQLKYSCDLQ